MYCPHCKSLIDDDSVFCVKCGKSVFQAEVFDKVVDDNVDTGEDEKYCSYCNTKIDSDSIFCPKCGRSVFEDVPEHTDDISDSIGLRFCPYCNRKIDNDSDFCIFCGKQLIDTGMPGSSSDIRQINEEKEYRSAPNLSVGNGSKSNYPMKNAEINNTIKYSSMEVSGQMRPENVYQNTDYEVKKSESGGLKTTDDVISNHGKNKKIRPRLIVMICITGALFVFFIVLVLFFNGSNNNKEENPDESSVISEEESEASVETNQYSEISEEASVESSTSPDNNYYPEGDSYVGKWTDNRCSVSITRVRNNTFEISVSWNNSSSQATSWKMTGSYNNENSHMEYTDGVKTVDYFDSNMNEQQTVSPEMTSGFFTYISEFKMYWHDDGDNASDMCEFHKVNEESEAEKKSEVKEKSYVEPAFFKNVPSECKQLLRVVSSGTTASMKLYDRSSGESKEVFSCNATVGQYGVGDNYGEGKKITPKGLFPLGVVLSANKLTEKMEWQPCSSSTVIVEDVNSFYYNQIMEKSSLPAGTDTDPIGNRLNTGENNACIFIEHNGNGYSQDGVVHGAGSSITICGCYDAIQPTWGCIDISSSDMSRLLGVLDREMNPYIKTE